MLMRIQRESGMADTKEPYQGFAPIVLPAAEHIRTFGIPGNRASNAIPPSDTPRYREFQRSLGLRKGEHIGNLPADHKFQR